jgi:hypothetical protein
MPPTLSFLRHRDEICEAISRVEMESTKKLCHTMDNTTTPKLASIKGGKKETIFNPKPAHMMRTRLGICEGRSNA